MTTKRRLAAVPDRPLRVVPYIRVSALMGRGGDDFHSPEVQLRAMRRKTIGMQEVEVIDCDIDRTGRDFAREGIDRIRVLAQTKAIDVVAVYNVSRFGRNTLESLLFLNELADHGVTIISAKENVDTSTPSGRKQLTDLLSLAQLRSEEIGESWRDVHYQRFLAGFQHGYAADGFMKKPDDKHLYRDPVMAPIMIECFERYARGELPRHIALYYFSATGRRIDPCNLKVRFRNPVYAGFVTLNDEVGPGLHDALIEPETWKKVQDRLAKDRTVPPREINPTWPMVGIVFHEGCGGRLQRYPRNRYGRNDDRLACGLRAGRVAGGCEGVGTPVLAKVEEYVLEQVAMHMKYLRSDHVARAAQRSRKASARADVATLERELTKTRRALGKLTTEWARDNIDDLTFKASRNELRDAETALVTEIEQARTTLQVPDSAEAASAAEFLLSNWDEMTLLEQGRALRTVVKKIRIRRAAYYREPERDRIEIDWVFGGGR